MTNDLVCRTDGPNAPIGRSVYALDTREHARHMFAGEADVDDGDDYEHTTPVSWESFSNERGWKPTTATKAGQFTAESVPPGNRRPT